MTAPAAHFEAHLSAHLGRVVFGMDSTVHGLALALVAGGHVLLEGVPGVGKTLLAKSLARLLGGRFRRVQCTADLMPADITGIHVYQADSGRFVLMPGPLFADVVLVDEINRTGPKTQSALLEAMEEGSVTIDRKTYALPENFLVIASQNPHEMEGTYPLPESQLDRFLLRLEVGYPTPLMEERVLRAYDHPGGGHPPLPAEQESLSRDAVLAARDQVRAVHVADGLYRYVTGLALASRRHPFVSLGLSTRGALALMRVARVEAALRERDYLTPDDVKAVAQPVMSHRLVLTADAALDGIGAPRVVGELLAEVPVPR